MKLPSITAWSLTSLVAMTTLAVAHDPKTQASTAPAEQVSEQAKLAVAVIEEFSSALKTGDLKRAGEVLADDVVILESGGAEHSRDEYLGGHAKHDAAFLERAAVGDVWSRRGGGVGLLSDYVLAQVTAGLVPMPSFMSAPDKAGSRRAPTDGQTKTAATHSGHKN